MYFKFEDTIVLVIFSSLAIKQVQLYASYLVGFSVFHLEKWVFSLLAQNIFRN